MRRRPPESPPSTGSTAAPGRGPTATSLTQAGARSTARCPRCNDPRLTQLSMTLTDGSHVEFTSCHKCEYKSWRQEGSELTLPSVLDKTRKLR